MSAHTIGPSRYRKPYARFETKRGTGSGSGYERWRSTEFRPETARKGTQDVFVYHHRLLAIVACYPADMPLDEILEHLDGRDVHHQSEVEWDNRPGTLAVREHGTHSAITQSQMRAWAENDRDRAHAEPSEHDRCDRCGEEATVLATSPAFADEERCLECSKQTADGSPIEVE